jgi:hypothetical protein
MLVVQTVMNSVEKLELKSVEKLAMMKVVMMVHLLVEYLVDH